MVCCVHELSASPRKFADRSGSPRSFETLRVAFELLNFAEFHGQSGSNCPAGFLLPLMTNILPLNVYGERFSDSDERGQFVEKVLQVSTFLSMNVALIECTLFPWRLEITFPGEPERITEKSVAGREETSTRQRQCTAVR